jgi:hypothetical protein
MKALPVLIVAAISLTPTLADALQKNPCAGKGGKHCTVTTTSTSTQSCTKEVCTQLCGGGAGATETRTTCRPKSHE